MDVAFAEAAQECSMPSDFATTTVLANFTVPTFARIASSLEACESVFQELLAEGHLDSGTASERIQAVASLRLLLNKCRAEEQLASLKVALAPQSVPPALPVSASPNKSLGWHEA